MEMRDGWARVVLTSPACPGCSGGEILVLTGEHGSRTKQRIMSPEAITRAPEDRHVCPGDEPRHHKAVWLNELLNSERLDLNRRVRQNDETAEVADVFSREHGNDLSEKVRSNAAVVIGKGQDSSTGVGKSQILATPRASVRVVEVRNMERDSRDELVDDLGRAVG
jgi:hypothetical protein